MPNTLAITNHPGLVAVRLLPNPDGQVPEHYLRQESDFMAEIQGKFYIDELGLEHIDPDPFPDPDNPEERAIRRRLMSGLGRINKGGLEHIGIFSITTTDEISTADSALMGILISSKATRRTWTPFTLHRQRTPANHNCRVGCPSPVAWSRFRQGIAASWFARRPS
jgi:hypothetical protein